MLAAGAEAQLQLLGDARPAALLASVRAVMIQSLRTSAFSGPVLGNAEAVVAYLRARMAQAPVESVLLLLLDGRRQLIRELRLSTGAVETALLAPREVIRAVLNANARAVILAHNHPSGDPAPSPADTELTRQIAFLLDGLGVSLFDHIIVAREGWTSFRALGLI
ncbi:MAG: repair protein RadC [Sphingomonadales bacterium]|nr:repair protein RadC [Sphingomonadales bacterium]MEA3045104.1 repair protein RadC [Sphingomonadales bacterium]